MEGNTKSKSVLIPMTDGFEVINISHIYSLFILLL